MAQPIICERCGDENPHDARFCIDCGATLERASTGPTTQLRGVACQFCQVYNPEPARFCVSCGRSLAGPAAPKPAAPKPVASKPVAPKPVAPKPGPAQQSYPRTATPPQMHTYRSAPIYRPSTPRRNPGPLVFVVGLALLLANGALWPGILVLIGVALLVGQLAQGRGDRAIGGLIWFGGLAWLFSSGRLWPGVLVLLLLSMILGNRGGPFGRHW